MIVAILIVFVVLSVGALESMPSSAAWRAADADQRHELRFDLCVKGICFVALVVAIVALATYEGPR